jgi:isopentenyldiphosphate isomerase
MSFLDRIEACNRHDPSRYRPFWVDGVRVGSVRADMAAAIRPYADTFAVDDRGVVLSPRLVDFQTRTEAVNDVLSRFANTGIMSRWCDELYAVTPSSGGPALFAMERAATPLFGVRAYGVHLSGYVRKQGRVFIWIGRRSRHKSTYPGLLDNTVAGGLTYGLSVRDCLAKECEEEAGIPPSLTAQAIPVGAVSYCAETPEGLRPDVMYCYDLALPPDFTPRCRDGEIEEFMLMPCDEVAGIVRETARFKFNCNLVIIDFLLRHGLIGPDEPDYLAIAKGLHQ